MDHSEPTPSTQIRADAEATVKGLIGKPVLLRRLIRELRRTNPKLPTLLRGSVPVDLVFELVRAVGVEIIVRHEEHTPRLSARAAPSDPIDAILDGLGPLIAERYPGNTVRPEEISDPIGFAHSVGELSWQSSAPIVGSVVVLIQTTNGAESWLHCGDGCQKHLYRVVQIRADNSTEMVFQDFFTYVDAAEAFPEAAIRLNWDKP